MKQPLLFATFCFGLNSASGQILTISFDGEPFQPQGTASATPRYQESGMVFQQDGSGGVSRSGGLSKVPSIKTPITSTLRFTDVTPAALVTQTVPRTHTSAPTLSVPCKLLVNAPTPGAERAGSAIMLPDRRVLPS